MQQELIEMLEEIIQYVEVWHHEDGEALDRAEALIKKAKNGAKEPAVPQGWKLVPVEPTDDEIRRAVNLPFVEDASGTEWVMLTPKTLARAVRRVLAAAPSQEPVNRPQNCGTSFCSCIECVCEPSQEPLTNFDAIPDEVIDTAQEKSGMYRVELMRAWDAIIAALREKEGGV